MCSLRVHLDGSIDISDVQYDGWRPVDLLQKLAEAPTPATVASYGIDEPIGRKEVSVAAVPAPQPRPACLTPLAVQGWRRQISPSLLTGKISRDNVHAV